MVKISLVSFTAIPHDSAESIHIVMMANSLSGICDFELISPFKIWRLRTFYKNLDMYGGGMERIKHRKFLQSFPNDTFFLNTILLKSKSRVFYCRQCLVADFFLKKGSYIILELHTLPSQSELAYLKTSINTTFFLALVVITESLKTDILEVIGSEHANHIYVLPDAADISKFNYQPLSKAPLERKVGYIGSNMPGKGWEIIEHLIERSDKEFHIYGFSSENVCKNAVFYGRVPYDKIPSALDTFDIGLLPNQPDVLVANRTNIGKYTSPMKLFEYMASGKVIIASDIPVIREVLKDNYNALLVKHDDIKAWKIAIDRLNSDTELYNRLQKQAYNDVCEKYSYMARAQSILHIIDSNIKGQ